MDHYGNHDRGGGENDIVAWIAIRKRGGRYQLCDFGVDKSQKKRDGSGNINNNDAALRTSCKSPTKRPAVKEPSSPSPTTPSPIDRPQTSPPK